MDVKGPAAKLAASLDGTNYSDVGGAKDVTFSTSRGTFDATDYDSGDWEEHLIGRGSMTINFKHNYDEADAGQDKIRTVNETPAWLWLRYRPMGDGAGQREIILKGTLESYEDSSPNDGIAVCSGSLKLTGAPTIQNQSA